MSYKQLKCCTCVFQADEFVVYSPHQQRMKFLVEFTIPDKESPMTDVSGEADEAGEADEPGEVEGVSTGVDEEEDSEGEMCCRLSSMYVYRNKYSRGVDWYVQ